MGVLEINVYLETLQRGCLKTFVWMMMLLSQYGDGDIVVNDERYFKEQLIFLIIHLSLHQIPSAHPPVFNAYLSVESSHRCHIAFYWSPRVLCSPLIGHREIDDQSMELSV